MDILPRIAKNNNLFSRELPRESCSSFYPFVRVTFADNLRFFENYFRYRYFNNTKQKWQDSSKTYLILK